MRPPSRAYIGKIVARKRKRRVPVPMKTALELYLYYLCFMKRLGRTCDDLAYK